VLVSRAPFDFIVYRSNGAEQFLRFAQASDPPCRRFTGGGAMPIMTADLNLPLRRVEELAWGDFAVPLAAGSGD
jgi:hypothetical protein